MTDASGTGDHPGFEFDRRFAAVRPRLLAISVGLVGPDSSEDVVQDAYVRARQKIRQLRDPMAFDAWLARLVVNASYNHRRGLRRWITGVTSKSEPSGPREARDVGLRELIEQLNSRDRTVIVLHYGYGYRLDEIADALGISHANARAVAHRARKRLADRWMEAHR